ncbi:MAG: 16S rRNA (cytosine(1402)-N(4))-methyltransferase RsmH [Phycisphaerales bacterium]
MLGVSGSHIPVLLDEVLSLLSPTTGETVVDLTAGLGGHAGAMARAVGATGRVLLCDLDAENLRAASARVAGLGVPVVAVHGSFASMPGRLTAEGIVSDVVLADLGFASNQVDDPQRGLSFRQDGPLDMRLDRSSGVTAAAIVNETAERELADLIYRYGEERASRRVASAIVRRRGERPFERTGDLAEVVRRSVPGGGRQRIDPATRTFQALRIAVNGELEALEGLLAEIERGARGVMAGGPSWLRDGSRVGVISFHSLEDRPVKRAMLAWEQAGLGRRLTRKPAVASESESASNPRARSAKFRVFVVDPWASDGGTGELVPERPAGR